MSAASHARLAYLALGDSYTIGEGVPAAQRWTHQLAAALRAENIPLATPQTIAATGWTTDELDAAIDQQPPPLDHALVTLLIGVNNQYRGRGLDDYAAQYQVLLQRAIGYANADAARVMALSIPDWGVTAFGRASGRDLSQVASEIDAFNTTARIACTRHGVAFVDITAISRACADQAQMLAEDGLHPSGAQYALWTLQAMPIAKTRLAVGA